MLKCGGQVVNLSLPRLSKHGVSLFGLIAHCLDDSAYAKKILTALPPEDWTRPPGRPRITWMKTVLNDIESHNLTLTEAVNMALEAAGCEWRYALIVVQAKNDDDDIFC